MFTKGQLKKSRKVYEKLVLPYYNSLGDYRWEQAIRQLFRGCKLVREM